MRSSLLILATGAALALSLGLKAALLAAPGARASRPPEPPALALRRFLAAQADTPLEPANAAADGWRFSKAGCRLTAFPSGPRGTLDMVPLAHVHAGDRVTYVYRGRLTAEPPSLALGMDVLAYLAAKPFRGGTEPGYVVLIAHDCAQVPDLPWSRLPS